jgi:hypothetical protein
VDGQRRLGGRCPDAPGVDVVPVETVRSGFPPILDRRLALGLPMIAVDNGSVDVTVEVLRYAAVQMVTLPPQRRRFVRGGMQ